MKIRMSYMGKKALSLVEITISMAILIVVMLPSFLAFSSGSQGIQMTESEFRAHSAALELMEQTISLPFDMIKSGFYEENTIKNGANFADTDAKYHLSFSSDYKLSMTVEDIVKNNRVFFKKVTVNVNYPITKNSDQKKNFSIKVIINNDNI